MSADGWVWAAFVLVLGLVGTRALVVETGHARLGRTPVKVTVLTVACALSLALLAGMVTANGGVELVRLVRNPVPAQAQAPDPLPAPAAAQPPPAPVVVPAPRPTARPPAPRATATAPRTTAAAPRTTVRRPTPARPAPRTTARQATPAPAAPAPPAATADRAADAAPVG